MFYLIGLGLGDAKDITVKGLEIIKTCDKIYLEAYTSILTVGKEALEKFYDREIILADRDMCETGIDAILNEAKCLNIALLVVGDPLGATTHTDLLLRAKEFDVKTQIVHNASIMNSIGACGLQLYNFGETISIPFWTETWKPNSFYPKILENYKRNLHTLCLLDIKVKEPTEESLTKKVKTYMEPKFMSVNIALEQINTIIGENADVCLNCNTFVVGVARIGTDSQCIKCGSIAELMGQDFGEPLHSLVIPAPELHPLEIEYLNQFKINKS